MTTQTITPQTRSEAVSMVLDGGMTFAEVASEKNVPKDQLHSWVEEEIIKLAATHEKKLSRKRGTGPAAEPTEELAPPRPEARKPAKPGLDDSDYRMADEGDDGSSGQASESEQRPRKVESSAEDTEVVFSDLTKAWDTPDAGPGHVLVDRPAGHQKPPEDAVVKFRCEHCGRKLKTDGKHMGRRVTCISCDQHVLAPADAGDPRVYFYQATPPRLPRET